MASRESDITSEYHTRTTGDFPRRQGPEFGVGPRVEKEFGLLPHEEERLFAAIVNPELRVFCSVTCGFWFANTNGEIDRFGHLIERSIASMSLPFWSEDV
jgi:hypothetical protein